jgi:hypothetical protein
LAQSAVETHEVLHWAALRQTYGLHEVKFGTQLPAPSQVDVVSVPALQVVAPHRVPAFV